MGPEKSLTDIACEQLERMIVFQELKPGMMYSEKKLAELMDVGRTPVREALQKLAWEQMVVIHPRRGIQIPVVSVESQLKLLEVRRPLEALCVKLAAQRATLEQKAEMKNLADGIMQCAKYHEDEHFMDHLRGCHEALVEAARNEYISKVMRPLQGPSRLFWFRHRESNTDHPASLHAAIMNRVAAGDSEGAEDASNTLIQYLSDFAVARLRM
ncbi:GntR family transcriptional regulator [Sansalvadorimonas sp. 2012CJ34-2]|uniref:GntR family transcriptional regulator n=1 Tax=Parendozoicomonas callyspongiae TaxID=2942213 RepID=A0ABT0PB38_9GAMM|nr:GntR family transcriptional regulator [Sansalvadorimonas sp. 2012CJ34-2]MCL6268599.1 GntR family transcriptional regulator [Sansalvadorimonas sp. 2012CJ34-2]